MSVQFYPNGIGGSAPGDSLDLAKPLQTTGNVWYVYSVSGVDAASPAGQNREKPLATLAQAVTNALDDDIIVFLPGHTQTLAAAQTVAKRLTLIGEGTSSGKPAVSFVAGVATALIVATTSNVELRNIYFPASLVANVANKLIWSGARGRIVNCYFEEGANDTNSALSMAAGTDQMRIEGCTFISTATSSAAQPTMAISNSAGSSIADLEIVDTVISAGTVGFSNYAAVDLTKGGGVATRCKFTGLSLLLGADVAMGASATGYVNVQLSTGGSRVSWG